MKISVQKVKRENIFLKMRPLSTLSPACFRKPTLPTGLTGLQCRAPACLLLLSRGSGCLRSDGSGGAMAGSDGGEALGRQRII